MQNIPSDTTFLFIHNKYLKTGGEDSVVENEINLLKSLGYKVLYKEFNNRNFQSKNLIKKLLGTGNFFFNFSAFFSTYFIIKKHKVKVLHVHNFFYSASPSVFWAGKLAGARIIMSMHNYRLFCLNALFFKAGTTCMECVTTKKFKPGIQSACFKSSTGISTVLAASLTFHRNIGTWKNKIDKFIVLNPLMKDLLMGIGVKSDKIEIKANFIADRSEADYQNRGNYYLYAGRIEEEKGIRHVIEAFKISKKKLIIAGEGSMTWYVEENISNTIQYIGQQNQEQMTLLYQQCKAVIFSSLLTEGMPMILIEAFATGTISIAAESVNTKSMISDGIDGFLYSPGSAESLNTVIEKFENIPIVLQHTLSKNARNKYEFCFSEKNHLKQVRDIYKL